MPDTLHSWWLWCIEWLLADDPYRSMRLAAIALIGVCSWRALWIYSQTPSAPRSKPANDVDRTPTAPRRAWFTSKPEKLARAVREAELETELLLKKTSSVRATAELEQARAQLNGLLQELKAQAKPQRSASQPAAAALTLREIDECLQLIALEPQQHIQLRKLLAARIEEKT